MVDSSAGVWHWAVMQAVALVHGGVPAAFHARHDLVVVLPLYCVALGWLVRCLMSLRRHGPLYGVALIWRIGWRVLSLVVLLTLGLLFALARSEGRAPLSSWRRF